MIVALGGSQATGAVVVTQLERLPDIVLRCQTDGHDEPLRFYGPDHVLVDASGVIHVDEYWGHGVHQFDATGAERAFVRASPSYVWELEKPGVPAAIGRYPLSAGPDWLVRSWLGPERDGLHWEHDRDRVLLVDAEGLVVHALGTYMNRVTARWAWWSKQAADGSFVCLSSMEDRRTPRLARIFDRNGELLAKFPVPWQLRPTGLAWSGSKLALATDCQVIVFDRDGRVIVDQDLDASARAQSWPDTFEWLVDFGADGGELWLRRGSKAITISRYRLP